jgi:uncharacterized OsmC-like protein
MYEAKVENRGDTRYHATTSGGHAFVMGTNGSAANPVDTVLAGLCACVGHYVRDFLHERRLASHGFAVEAEAESTPDGSRLASIAVWIDLRDAPLDDAGRAQVLVAAARCKVHNTLKAACPLTLALGRRPAQAAASASA